MAEEVIAPETAVAEQVGWQLRARQAAGALAVGGTLFAGGFLAGDMLTPTHVMLGPHEATVKLTVNRRISIDAGPIGSIDAPSGSKWGGLKIRLGEIPDGEGGPLQASDVAEYEQFFTEPGFSGDKAAVKSALIWHGVESGTLTAGAALVGLWVMGPQRRRWLREIPHNRRLRSTAGAMLALTLVSGSVEAPPAHHDKADPVLESLGIHDVHVSGRILETGIDEYGADVLKTIRVTDAYYARYEKKVIAAYKAKLAAEAHATNGLAAKIANGEVISVMWSSDDHCNRNTMAIMGKLAREVHPDITADTGDQTITGSSAEKACVSTLPHIVGKTKRVVSEGNHDSPDVTAKQNESLGTIVLHGKVVKVAGLTILGDSDVERTVIGQQTKLNGTETVHEEGERIKNVACENGGVDIAMMHDPAAVQATVLAGCAKIGIAGHLHVLKGPLAYVNAAGETSYMMLNGTTGGAAPGKPTFESKLGKVATIVQLYFDKKTKDPIGYRVITLDPNGDVTVTDPYPMSVPSETLPIKR